MIPKHYHITLLCDKTGTKELVVSEHKGKWNVVDDWGEITGEPNRILATFEDAKTAVGYAIKELNGKYKGKILAGAGCPPTKWIDEFGWGGIY